MASLTNGTYNKNRHKKSMLQTCKQTLHGLLGKDKINLHHLVSDDAFHSHRKAILYVPSAHDIYHELLSIYFIIPRIQRRLYFSKSTVND